MNKCPKCGGTNGFTYNLIMKTNRIGDWGLDNDEETDVERVRDVSTVTCMDCGKRIDWNVAHGLEAVEQSVQSDGSTTCAKCGADVKGLVYCKVCGTDTPRH